MNSQARSPDMSPIENLWDEFGRRVYQRRPAPATVPQLRRAIEDEWDNMSHCQKPLLCKQLPEVRLCYKHIKAFIRE